MDQVMSTATTEARAFRRAAIIDRKGDPEAIKRLRAVIYNRISDDKTGAGDGVERQEDDHRCSTY
jgi:cytidylate kinase